ncbi:MAG: hypothetical protein JST43_10470 [Bacteroidetes bacterium]|nr:hypothetical protein [Bacteroidota bacterium]MBS1540513.1 hypothetical protein [Bacteroidota bacterium]
MAKSEIKLRKELLADATLHRHRNYASLLKQHEREKQKKWTRRIFVFSFLVAIILILLLLLVSFWMVKLERDREKNKNQKGSYVSLPSQQTVAGIFTGYC